MVYACRRCGARSPTKVCATCAPNERPAGAHWSKGRDRKKQAAFRKRMIREFGGQCGAVLGDGSRCPVTLATGELQAHHTHPGDDTRGALLCREHHRAVDPHAR